MGLGWTMFREAHTVGQSKSHTLHLISHRSSLQEAHRWAVGRVVRVWVRHVAPMAVSSSPASGMRRWLLEVVRVRAWHPHVR